MVYDITNRQSLESIPKWLEEIDRYCTQDIVVILVGNKLDLDDVCFYAPFLFFWQSV